MGFRVILDRALCTVCRCQIGTTPVIIFGNVNFILGEHGNQIFHAEHGIFGIDAVRITGHQNLERIECILCRFRVTFRQILPECEIQKAQTIVEIDQAFQIIHIIDVWMIRVQFDETFSCRQSLRLFILAVVGIGNIHLGLLGVYAERISCFQLFEVFDGFFVIARV